MANTSRRQLPHDVDIPTRPNGSPIFPATSHPTVRYFMTLEAKQEVKHEAGATVNLRWNRYSSSTTHKSVRFMKNVHKVKTRPCRPIRCDVWIVERMRYQPTNRPTDRPKDTASYRGALSQITRPTPISRVQDFLT